MVRKRLEPVGKCVALVVVLLFAGTATAQRVRLVDLEDLSLAPESYYNGENGAGGFTSRLAFFNNLYNPTWGTWSGWSYSNVTDVQTPGFMNQYSAYQLPGGGGDHSKNFAVAFNFSLGDATVKLPPGRAPHSVRITNSTYAALSMRDGDGFAKKFGGATGNDPDFFLLTIHGFDRKGNATGSVDFYLADYRSPDNSQDYIVDQWTTVNLAALGDAVTLMFELTSSDIDPVFGMNTPAYFALDNLVTAPSGSDVSLSDGPGGTDAAARETKVLRCYGHGFAWPCSAYFGV